MVKWIVATVMWLSASPALAADQPDASGSDASYTLQDPAAAAEAAKAAEEEKKAKRLAALEALNKGKQARIVVLKVDDTDFSNMTLQRNVRSRIARPDAKFYPDIDLYQNGRREPDRALRPIEQRAAVPQESVDIVLDAIAEVENIPWDGMSETSWGLKAQDLRHLADEIWFIDRPELREPLFQLYVQLGRAAENMNNTSPPFYETIGGQPVNYYWFLAGAMAFEDPAMLDLLTDAEVAGSIAFYQEQLDNQAFPLLTMSFEANGVWDAAKFAGKYVVTINGIERLIDDKNGLFKAPPGRVDIQMDVGDGKSLSERVDLDKLDDKIYFVRDVARKRMGIDFANQLMEHPNECTPEVDGDILTYLNIYAKLHESSEVYVAVPMAGNPNKTHLWRFDRPTGTLQKVLDSTGGFPVRFAALIGTGIILNSATLTEPAFDPVAGYDEPDLGFGVGAIPIDFQLRLHYSRLLVIFGYQLGISAGDPYLDRYQTPGGLTVYENGTTTEGLKSSDINHMWSLAVGGMLMKEASSGIGPRGYVRAGVLNVPHVVDLSGHVGMTVEAPFSKGTGRVRPIGDIDLFGGMLIPFGKTLLEKQNSKGNTVKTVLGNVGLTVSVGATF